MSSYLSNVIDLEHLDRKRTLTEIVTFASFGWALWSNPYTVIPSMAAGAVFAHVIKKSPLTAIDNPFHKFKARVIANDGGYYDEMLCLTATGFATGLLNNPFTAVLTGVNSGQLLYRDVSRILYGRNPNPN